MSMCPYCNGTGPMEQAFTLEVERQHHEIDPGEGHDWYSLVLGWALGKGMNNTDAQTFALHIHYHTNRRYGL